MTDTFKTKPTGRSYEERLERRRRLSGVTKDRGLPPPIALLYADRGAEGARC